MLDSFELTLSRSGEDEQDEVKRAKDRDPGTWSAWYDRYFPLLYRYALARTGRREEAEDIASQAFVRALEGIDSFAYRGRPVLAWLYRITHNLVADRIRQNKRRPALPLALVAQELAQDEPGLSSVELFQALRALNDEQRDSLVLRFMVDLSGKEVASMMGKSESAVHSLQLRALANLRKLLKIR